MSAQESVLGYRVFPSQLSGTLRIPPSKSHTMRAIFFASWAHGTSIIRHALKSPDVEAMIAACRQFGADIQPYEDPSKPTSNDGQATDGQHWVIRGTGGTLTPPQQSIDVGNSGQVLRFMGALAGCCDRPITLTGDASIQKLRPMGPLISALEQRGANVRSDQPGYAPVVITGPITPGPITIDGYDSQPISAWLMVAGLLGGTTTLKVRHLGERPWVALTLDWLDRMGIAYSHRVNDQEDDIYTVVGPVAWPGFDYTVPGDWSTAAFPLAAAVITQSPLTLDNLDIGDIQGDKVIVPILRAMGAMIDVDESKKQIHIRPHQGLSGITLNANDAVDAVPILAVLGCFAWGETVITGVRIARHKESNRLSAMTQELSAMGADITEDEDGLVVTARPLAGHRVSSHHDHRVALALMVAGMGASSGHTDIMDVSCVQKTYPNCYQAWSTIGAHIECIS